MTDIKRLSFVFLVVCLAACSSTGSGQQNPTKAEKQEKQEHVSFTIVNILVCTERAFRSAVDQENPLEMARAARERAGLLLGDSGSEFEISLGRNIAKMFSAAIRAAAQNEELVSRIQRMQRRAFGPEVMLGSQIKKFEGPLDAIQRRLLQDRGSEVLAVLRPGQPITITFSAESSNGLPIYIQPQRPDAAAQQTIRMKVTHAENTDLESTPLCDDRRTHGRLICYLPPMADIPLMMVIESETKASMPIYIFIGDKVDR